MGKQSQKKAERRARRQRGEATEKPERWRAANIRAKGKAVARQLARAQAKAAQAAAQPEGAA